MPKRFQNTKSNFSSTEKNHLKKNAITLKFVLSIFQIFFQRFKKKKNILVNPAFYNTSDKREIDSQFFRRDINRGELCKIPRLRFFHAGKNVGKRRGYTSTKEQSPE